jgi:hypothetical protein
MAYTLLLKKIDETQPKIVQGKVSDMWDKSCG